MQKYLWYAIVPLLIVGTFFVFNKSEFQLRPVQVGETIQVGGKTIQVDVADSTEERERGLSGRTSLEKDQGMLFIFPENGQHSFWMKDMNFSIDIIWIAESGEIVHIEQDVAPESYPTIFTPQEESRYVLEVPAGFVGEHSIRVGDIVTL
ncbi:DUF192 domain-containing protein [Candidatus Parcubacteria bacterium]|nr:MAG: DUF192 domain-containing protein [Candidatus Parcubacteria bacterium]